MIEKNHRRKMPELDFIKVKRKIRSVPASPKHSPTSTNKTPKWNHRNKNNGGGFYKNLRKKSADAGSPPHSAIASMVKNCISSPNTPLNGSRNDLTKLNDEIFDEFSSSVGCSSNVKNSIKKVHLNVVQSFSDDDDLTEKNHTKKATVVARRRRSEAGEICRSKTISQSSRVCVILNDDELLLVSEKLF